MIGSDERYFSLLVVIVNITIETILNFIERIIKTAQFYSTIKQITICDILFKRILKPSQIY